MRKSPVINIMQKTCHEASIQLLRDFNELACLKNNRKLDQFIAKMNSRVLNIITTNLLRSNPNNGIIHDSTIIKDSNNNFYWMINPLTGKQNFLHRLPFFGLGIALLEEPYKVENALAKNVIASMFYDPIKSECFFAEQNNGTFLNDRKLSALTTPVLTNIKLSSSSLDATVVEKLIVSDNNLGNRNLGSSLMHIAYIAAKRLDSMCEKMDNLTDICIGKLLINEAKGSISYNNSGKIYAKL